MESIRVKNKDTYKIEVNDNGDIIEFDITDIELPFKFERAQKMAQDAVKWLKGQIVVIGKKEDIVKKGDMMSSREKATLEAYRTTFRKMRAAVDEFAGFGASQKIFGDQNYLEMFNDFIDQMEPHFEKMQIRGIDIRKRIEEKYGATPDDEI